MQFRPKRTRYDWKKWKRGGVARKGRDFRCSIDDFRSAVYRHAGRSGLIANVTVSGTEVTFRFRKAS